MPIHSRILATAGHVDHGKSALVKALSGIDPDRLPEEKARGITIDLGFAHILIDAPGPNGQQIQFQVGIVDVPGHEDFVKNMVAGVGAVDLALLVVAADDGWMPQTEEHLDILLYLGVKHAVVAMTKVDLVSAERQRLLEEEIRARLKPTRLAGAEIIPTSVANGRGLDLLTQSIARALLDAPAPRDIGKPRLAVDRAFSLRGVGTVVTGTLIGGSLSRGQSVIIQPAGYVAKIRSMQNHNREIEQAFPGSRVAINLPELQVLTGEAASGKPQVGRGDVVTISNVGSPTETLDAMLFRTERELSPMQASPLLRDGARVWMHHGSGNVAARVRLYGPSSDLPPGVCCMAQLRLERRAFLLAGDHFILRDWPQRQTLAGGIVLDAAAQRKDFRSSPRRDMLLNLQRAGDNCEQWVLAMVSGKGLVERSRLLHHACFSEEQVTHALESLSRAEKLTVRDAFVATTEWWQGCLGQAAAAIDAEHRSHPQKPGLALADLRAALKARVCKNDALFAAIVSDLLSQGFIQTGAAICRASHRPALPPELHKAGEKIRAILRAKSLDPPSRKELAPDPVSFQALKFLLQVGEAVDVGPEVVLASEAYSEAIQRIRDHISSKGAATVSELKQTLSTTRRVMVPLLEKLDREGITQRRGDQRVLKPNALK